MALRTQAHEGDHPPSARAAEPIPNYIGGAWVPSRATESLPLTNPATGEPLGRVPLSGTADVDAAVQAALDAFPRWRATPPVVRARYLFALKGLLETHFDELAAIVTRENGKTLDESRGSVRRAIENVEHACGIPTLLLGAALEDVATGIDCEYVRQPMGVFAAITPFNFPAMVPLWFWPYAIASGNTFVLKPSEQVPLSSQRMVALAHEAGIPPGVLNLVHGGKDAVNAILAHEHITGVSFVGSTPVARHVYATAAQHGKRVQALGGAKNHVIVMPDADLDRTTQAVTESIFGCAGQRCLAGSVVVAAGSAYGPLNDDTVFDHATYADLLKSGGPYVVVNGADVTTGGRFPYTQETFDVLCSDLSAFPIARAVATSSALPPLLYPITLRNHAGRRIVAMSFCEPRSWKRILSS